MSTEIVDITTELPAEFGGFLKIPADLYHRIDAFSYSRGKELAKSPAHCRRMIDFPRAATEAMKRGTMIHMAALEQHVFSRSYVVVPESLSEGITTKDGKAATNPKATSEYKERLSKFATANFGKEFVSQDEWNTAQAVANTLRAHPRAGAFIEMANDTEVTGVWQFDGVKCKMRIDADCAGIGTIFDIKTTADASPGAFSKTIFNFRYYWQAALYLDGMAALGKPRTDYVIIAVETEPPYGCAVYRLKDEIIDLARQELRPLIALYRRCLAENRWPSYPIEIQDIGLPDWSVRQIEKEIV